MVHEIEMTEPQVAMLVTLLKDDIEASSWNECDYSDTDHMGYLKDRADVLQMLKGLLANSAEVFQMLKGLPQ